MDITSALTKSRTGQHDLVIRVFDPSESAHIVLGKQRMHPDSTIFYKGVEGIWGSVWLEPVSVLCHFASCKRKEMNICDPPYTWMLHHFSSSWISFPHGHY